MANIEEDGSGLETILKQVPSYHDVKRKERLEKELIKDTELKEVFIGAVEYYKENYPKSNRKLIWRNDKEHIKFDENKLLKEIFDGFNEEDLITSWIIIDYNIQEHNYTKIPKLTQYTNIKGKLIHLIPAGKYMEEDHILKREIQIKNIRIKEIEEIREEERKKLKKRVEESKNKFICEFEGCGKVCANKGSLTNHMKIHKNGD